MILLVFKDIHTAGYGGVCFVLIVRDLFEHRKMKLL